MDMERLYKSIAATIANGAALSDAIDMRKFAGGSILIPSAWTAANLGFQFSDTEAGTYTWLENDDDGVPVQITDVPTAQSVWKPIPAKAFGAPWMKLWSKHATAATETGVNQGAERTLTVFLKG